MKDFPGAITICDSTGIIIDLNNKAVENFREQGARNWSAPICLTATRNQTRLNELMEKRQIKIFTIEKNGVKKLIHRAPWCVGGKYQSFVELSQCLMAAS